MYSFNINQEPLDNFMKAYQFLFQQEAVLSPELVDWLNIMSHIPSSNGKTEVDSKTVVRITGRNGKLPLLSILKRLRQNLPSLHNPASPVFAVQQEPYHIQQVKS